MRIWTLPSALLRRLRFTLVAVDTAHTLTISHSLAPIARYCSGNWTRIWQLPRVLDSTPTKRRQFGRAHVLKSLDSRSMAKNSLLAWLLTSCAVLLMTLAHSSPAAALQPMICNALLAVGRGRASSVGRR